MKFSCLFAVPVCLMCMCSDCDLAAHHFKPLRLHWQCLFNDSSTSHQAMLLQVTPAAFAAGCVATTRPQESAAVPWVQAWAVTTRPLQTGGLGAPAALHRLQPMWWSRLGMEARDRWCPVSRALCVTYCSHCLPACDPANNDMLGNWSCTSRSLLLSRHVHAHLGTETSGLSIANMSSFGWDWSVYVIFLLFSTLASSSCPCCHVIAGFDSIYTNARLTAIAVGGALYAAFDCPEQCRLLCSGGITLSKDADMQSSPTLDTTSSCNAINSAIRAFDTDDEAQLTAQLNAIACLARICKLQQQNLLDPDWRDKWTDKRHPGTVTWLDQTETLGTFDTAISSFACAFEVIPPSETNILAFWSTLPNCKVTQGLMDTYNMTLYISFACIISLPSSCQIATYFAHVPLHLMAHSCTSSVFCIPTEFMLSGCP